MNAEHGEQHKFHVRVLAPSEPHPKTFAFEGNEVVGTAATEAATEFGLHPTAPSFELRGTVLDRTITLEAAGVHNGDELELVDVGGGV